MVERMRLFWDKSGVSICLTLTLLLAVAVGWMLCSLFTASTLKSITEVASSERTFLVTTYEGNLQRMRERIDDKNAEIKRLTDIVASSATDAGKAAVSASNAAEAAAKAAPTTPATPEER